MGRHAAAARRFVAAFALAAEATGRLASAQGPPAAAPTAAALFDEAKGMMDQGNYAEACPKLAESEALDPQVGTLLNLALCYESTGKTASACSMWRVAADAAARKLHSDREALARERADGTCSRAPQVTVQIAEQPERDRMLVTINGTPLSPERWGQPTPLDPGDYELRASGEGVHPWTWKFRIDDEHLEVVVVPALTPIAAPVASQAAPPASRTRSRSFAPAVWVAGGVGLAAIGASAAFGSAALVEVAASRDGRNCVGNNCNATGASARARAASDAEISDVTLAVGVGAIVTSVILWAASPRASRPSSGAYVAPAVSLGAWSVAVGEVW